MWNYDGETRPLTREVLEEFTKRCEQLSTLEVGSTEYNKLGSAIYNDASLYDAVEDYDAPDVEGDKEGFRNDLLDHWYVPPMFDTIKDIINYGSNIIVFKGDKAGITDTCGKGTMVIPCIYDNLEMVGILADLVKTELDGKFGLLLLTRSGKVDMEIKPIYDNIEQIGRGDFIQLEKDGKFGLFKYGYMLPVEYDRIFIPQIVGWVKVMKDGVWGYIDADNQFTTDLNKAFLYHCH